MNPYDDLGKLFAKQFAPLTGMSDFAASLKRITSQLAPGPLIDFAKIFPQQDFGNMLKTISQITKMTAISSGFLQGLRATTPDFKAFADLARMYKPDFAAFGALQKSIDSLTFPILSFDSFRKAEFAGIANLYERVGSEARPREGAPQTFVREKLREIAEIERVEAIDDIETNFKHIEKSIIDRIKQTPALRISFEGWMNLLLTLFVFLYSTISSEKFQTHLEGRIDSIERLDSSILVLQRGFGR